MRTRITRWLDTDRLECVFGVEVFVGGAWRYAHESGTPLLYATEAQAEEKRAELRKRKTERAADK